MAGQTYQVNYIVNVDATNAQSAVNSFKRAVASMDKATKPLMDLQRQVRGLMDTMSALNRGRYTVKIDTKPATQKIGKLIRALQMAKSEVQQLNAMGVTLGGASSKARSTSRTTPVPAPVGGSRPRTVTSRPTPTPAPAYTKPRRVGPTNLGYKLWGPTPLPNNGGMAIDMLKGMGIAYGIAGLGTMVSNIVDQAAEYDNLMKTVENILKSHDTKANFSGRFSSMTSTVRNVGMETKFKVTEVADAAKFLAMAGLDVNAISQSIRPIADIALVGDTELGQTADLVTNIMTAYNIAPARMRNAADIMTNTFTMSNTTLTEIAEAYKYAASLLSAGGVPFEEATAAIGVLGDAGIKGSQAGTTLRTIMANVVNPTKRQKAAWDELGVNRYNADGSRKNLLEIFKELNNANLGVDAYYRLFHKTAASGAVALASHVDKWEDVYLENFLAGGLSSHLADEKKNTLKGLWAQLVSIFTDKGVTAFNGVQGQLRSLMTKAISWLKTDQATQAFKSISKSLMEFVDVIITASKWFVKFFDMFGPAIKTWAKFQLMIWPVVKAVTAFYSIFRALQGLRKVGFMIMGLGNSFKALGTSAAFAGKNIASANAAAATGTLVTPAAGVVRQAGPWGSMFALSNRQTQWAQRGVDIGWKNKRLFGVPLGGHVWKPLDISAPRYDRGSYDIVGRHQTNRKLLLKHKQAMKAYNRRLMVQQGFNAAGGLAGAAGVGYGMHQIAEANNGYDTASGVFYGIAGTAAMIGGPWGWGIAAGAAIIGGIMQVLGSAAQSNKIYGELQDFAKKNAIDSGTIAGSESQTMKYLEAQYTTYNNINDLIQKRIDLTAQLLGLQSGDNPMDASTGVFQGLMEKHEDLWNSDKLEAFNAIYRDKFKTNQHLINHNGAYYLTTADSLKGNYVNEGGRSVYKVRGVNGEEAIRVGNATTSGLEAAFASMAATAEIMAPGGYYEKLVEGLRLNVSKLGMKGASTTDFDNYINQIIQANDPQHLSNLVGLSDIKDTDWDLNRMLLDEQTRQFMWSQLEALLIPMKDAFHNFRSEVDANNLSAGTLANYLKYVIGNQPGLSIKDYDPNNISNWYANYGFSNGTFNGFTTTDANGIVKAYTAEEAAQMAASNMQSIIDAVKQSGAASTDAGIALMGFCNVLLTQAQAFTGATEEMIDVAENQEITLNGQLYRWNEILSQYEAIDANGQLQYIQTQVTGMSNSINFLGQSLGYDWTTAFGGLSNSLAGTYDYLNMLGSIRFGTPYIPSTGFGNNRGFSFTGTGFTGGTTGFGTGSTGFRPRLSLGLGAGTGGFNLFGSRTNFFQQSWQRNLRSFQPQALSLQQASNVVANGGGVANGWKSTGGNHTNNGTNDANGTGSGRGSKSSDYKSHQKERAIPKQININIQNLMNVDKVDMTNSDNVAVVERLKREVAYALVEAASDGTMMLNGLTT